MKLRVMIVDDEDLARDRLRRLLSAERDVQIIGECGDGKTAVEKISELKPDLVFLDVQMPELDGFQTLESLPADELPNVIFVTAHDKFALKAFDVHAVDYLLKPFDRARFQTALQRAFDKFRAKSGEAKEDIAAVLNEAKASRVSDRIAVKTEGKVALLKLDDIDLIESADNYISLYAGNASHLLRETMNSIESRLPPEKFVRVSRSSIVNINRVKELQPLFHGEYVVILTTGRKTTLTRSYREKLPQLLGKTQP